MASEFGKLIDWVFGVLYAASVSIPAAVGCAIIGVAVLAGIVAAAVLIAAWISR